MDQRQMPTPATAAATALTLDERRAKLQNEIRVWVAQGYRVFTQTDTSAQLVKPKQFSFLWALILTFTVVGIVVYLLWYLTRRDKGLHIEIGPTGDVFLNGKPRRS